MTLALMKERCDTKDIADHPQDPKPARSLDELRHRLSRRLSDLRDGWKCCDDKRCRRRKQCCGDGPDFTCTGDRTPRRTLSREEQAKVMSELYKELERRCAEFAAGAEP